MNLARAFVALTASLFVLLLLTRRASDYGESTLSFVGSCAISAMLGGIVSIGLIQLWQWAVP